ncbi:MAG: rhodanese-like domain-containing protein [Candidatus Altiarchaeota archaeon]
MASTKTKRDNPLKLVTGGIHYGTKDVVEDIPSEKLEKLMRGAESGNDRDKAQLRKLREEKYRERKKAMDAALPQGEEVWDEQTMLSVVNVRRYIKEAGQAKKNLISAKDDEEREAAAQVYAYTQKRLDDFLDQSPQFYDNETGDFLKEGKPGQMRPVFEKMHRLFLKEQRNYDKYVDKQDRLSEVEEEIERRGEQRVEIVKRQKKGEPGTLDSKNMKALAITSRLEEKAEAVDSAEVLGNLERIYSKDSREYKALKARLESKAKGGEEDLKKMHHKKLVELRDGLRKEIADLDEDTMIEHFRTEDLRKKLIKDLDAGNDVLLIPYTVEKLQELRFIEKNNPNTTIGCVAVGEPGTGKTTAIRQHIHDTGREFAYIDMSGDVSRFMLYGSKSVSVGDPIEQFTRLTKALESFDVKKVGALVQAGVDAVGPSFLALIDEEIGKEGALNVKNPENVKKQLQDIVEKQFNRELATEIYKYGKQNGWRYGFLVDCLRKGVCPIIDEFNKSKDLSLLHSLMTAVPAADEEAGPEPGKDADNIKKSHRGWWYFADNNEWIRVPKDWRMFFTGNIGAKHKVHSVVGALGSRMEGKVIFFDYPPAEQEYEVMQASVSDSDGEVRRSRKDMQDLMVLTGEAVPKIRKGIAKMANAIPISLRSTRQIGGLLFNRQTQTPKDIALDKAVKWVLVDTYAITEDKEPAKLVVAELTACGILLSEGIGEKLVEDGLLKEADLERKRESHKIGYRSVSVDDFKELVGEDGTFLLDARATGDKVIKGTQTSIPHDKLQKKGASKKDSGLPADKNAKIAVYCDSDGDSAQAARALAAAGYKRIYTLEGGFSAWEAKGYDVEQKQQSTP